ncbi:MAG: prepilin-type N-terminal cleavage/methylation domain-containing protein [Limisphaerales bacterium]|jgi:prepilin-type N-terminal cleavage/methylation domain-containing protein
MSVKSRSAGFTLVELMITLVIMGVLFSFALPAYRGYIATSEEGVLRSNMMSIEVFQEDLMMRTGAYAHTQADLAAITLATGWDPRTVDGITYSIAISDGTFYQLTAVHPNDLTVCIDFPDKDPC